MKTQRTLCFYRFLIVSCTLLFGSFFAFGQDALTISSKDQLEMFFERKTLTMDEANSLAKAKIPIGLRLFMKVPSDWDLTKIGISFSDFEYAVHASAPTKELILTYNIEGSKLCPSNVGFMYTKKAAQAKPYNIPIPSCYNLTELAAYSVGFNNQSTLAESKVNGTGLTENIIEVGTFFFLLPEANGKTTIVGNVDIEAGKFKDSDNPVGYIYGTRNELNINFENQFGAVYRATDGVKNSRYFTAYPEWYNFNKPTFSATSIGTDATLTWVKKSEAGLGGITVLAGLGILS